MRAAFTLAAFAAGALAVPYKRDIVTDINVVYVTDIVTVTAGQPMPTPVANVKHNHHHHAHQHSTVVAVIATSSAEAQAAPSSEVEAAPASPSAAIASVAAVVQSAVAPAAAAPTSYQEIVLYHHNLHRQNHSAPALVWDDGLEASAATIAASCIYAHNVDVDGGGYGQNIAAGVGPSNVSSIITDMFYNGEEPYFSGLYGQANPDMSSFENWGHFSQIVWKSTTSVACATQYCSGGLANTGGGVSPYFTVCNYKGPGNYAGEYNVNVLAPVGMPTAQWNAGL